jgi:Trypsin-co-occurring domain 2
MADQGSGGGLGLAEAIESLRDDLLKARAAGATSEIQLPVESMTVELTVTATRSIDSQPSTTSTKPSPRGRCT